MKNFIFILLGAWFAVGNLSAQAIIQPCGMSFDDLQALRPRLLENLAAADMAARDRGNNVRYVPVHFHLVGDAAGANRLRTRIALDALCALNKAFQPHDIQFYLSPHPTTGSLISTNTNDANVYDNQSNTALMASRRHRNALNYFVVNEPRSNNNQPGQSLAYYSITNDWIVIRKSEMSDPLATTLAHETGHFFSLQHTFNGWEVDAEESDQPPCFESGDPTWPVAPSISPRGIPTERVDKSNCTNAGDNICDTPPDYNFGFCANRCALYTGGAQDPTGTLVDPMENNYMSYYNGCASYQFTPNQVSAMQADVASRRRSYLNNTFVPVTEITVPTELLNSPASGATVPFFDEVNLEWQAVPGARYYFVEVDITQLFSSVLLQTFITTDPTLTVRTLTANRSYFWRVRPFNEYTICGGARLRTFRTSQTSGVPDIVGLDQWQLAPNPILSGQAPRLMVQTSTRVDAHLRIFDAAGRVFWQQSKVTFPVGDTVYDIPAGRLPAGLYFIVLESANGRAVKRLSVI
jgi:Pregnancy-associated plasma protein-A